VAATLASSLSAQTGQNDADLLFKQVKDRLRPAIEELTQASAGLGPQITDLQTHEPLLSNFTVSQFLQRERSRLAELFSARPLRPLQVAVLARLDEGASRLQISPANPITRPCRGDCVSRFSFSGLISDFASYLTRVEQLPSLVTNITVTSAPAGAAVLFVVGTSSEIERQIDTNSTAANLFLGDYTVKIAKDGYKSKELPIKLLDEPLTAIACTLRRTSDAESTTCERHR
jgi:hypothetical protein